MGSKPTYEQAQLHLQVYDQRREAKLRQARDWFGKNYIVNNIDDAMRIAPMGSETGTYVGMVIGYWEQACALLNYGLLNEDLFFETSGEFFGVWEALKPARSYGMGRRKKWRIMRMKRTAATTRKASSAETRAAELSCGGVRRLARKTCSMANSRKARSAHPNQAIWDCR